MNDQRDRIAAVIADMTEHAEAWEADGGPTALNAADSVREWMGKMMGDGPTALDTRTTAPDFIGGEESVFSTSDPRFDPTAPVLVNGFRFIPWPKHGRDSGQDAPGEAFSVNGTVGGVQDEKGPGGDPTRPAVRVPGDYWAWEDSRKPGHVAPDGSIWSANARDRYSSGTVGIKRDQADAARAAGWRVFAGDTMATKDARPAAHYNGPTPAEQRERFAALAREPRPDAATIKAVLEYLAKEDRLAKVADVVDRLGVYVLALELERDELRAAVRQLQEQAHPIDGTDLAELVQGARAYVEQGRRDDNRAALDLVGRMIGALNDQARKLAALEPVGDDMDTTIEDARKLIVASVTTRVDVTAWNLVMSRLRYFLIEERKARRKAEAEVFGLNQLNTADNDEITNLRDQLDTAHALIEEAKPVVESHERNLREGWPYDDRQRERATMAILEWTGSPRGDESREDDCRVGVDRVAKALGMRRADA